MNKSEKKKRINRIRQQQKDMKCLQKHPSVRSFLSRQDLLKDYKNKYMAEIKKAKERLAIFLAAMAIWASMLFFEAIPIGSQQNKVVFWILFSLVSFQLMKWLTFRNYLNSAAKNFYDI